MSKTSSSERSENETLSRGVKRAVRQAAENTQRKLFNKEKSSSSSEKLRAPSSNSWGSTVSGVPRNINYLNMLIAHPLKIQNLLSLALGLYLDHPSKAPVGYSIKEVVDALGGLKIVEWLQGPEVHVVALQEVEQNSLLAISG